MADIDANNISLDRQHAFKKSHSCTAQLCHVINDWSSNTDFGLQTDDFIVDFAKDFDKVAHERLKAKLFSYGISGHTLIWIDFFLCQRKQRVVVNGCGSDWSCVTSGAPQGAVLGPILFDLFIYHIFDVVSQESEILLFADDCICYRKVCSLQDCDTLQQDFERQALWADT